MSIKKGTSADIRKAMRLRWCQPEWSLMFEVADATGGRHTRTADAVAMNMYPSRGLAVHGFEIKTSRRDWLMEFKDPSKAAAVAKYCDYWWLITVPGIVEKSELPLGWGHILFDPKRGLHVKKNAERMQQNKVLDRSFLASMLRAVGKVSHKEVEALINARLKSANEGMDDRVKYEVNKRTKKAAQYATMAEHIKEITGNDNYLDDHAILKAVALVFKAGVAGSYGGLKNVSGVLRNAAARIDRAFK